jgi:ATP-dependent Clp protease ATP-binding subunit ClpC
VLASESAIHFQHNFIGTEHLLLGLLALGQGLAVNILQRLGLDFEAVRKQVEVQIGFGPDQKIYGQLPYTPRVKKIVALAANEAVSLDHAQIGPEHILLGLLREGDGVAGRVLLGLGVNIEKIREEVCKGR